MRVHCSGRVEQHDCSRRDSDRAVQSSCLCVRFQGDCFCIKMPMPRDSPTLLDRHYIWRHADTRRFQAGRKVSYDLLDSHLSRYEFAEVESTIRLMRKASAPDFEGYSMPSWDFSPSRFLK